MFVLVGFALFCFARAFQEDGHGWGDDFALYINQAQGLTDGTANDVVADTRFAIDNSAYHSFSPEAYPWGFPVLLAGIVAVRGVDYTALKVVPTLSLVGAVLVLYLLLASRLTRVEAVLVSALFALNSWYLSRTDQVLSDLTFWFLLLLALYLLDRRLRAGTILLGNGTLAAGVCVLAAFNVRREGALVLVGLATAQIAAAISSRRSGRPLPRRDLWRPILAPYAAFLAGAVAIQLLRPSPILNPSEDVGSSGLQNMWPNLRWYWDRLAELLGLKAEVVGSLDLFGNSMAAEIVLGVILVLAALGIVAVLVRRPRRDLHLVVTVVAISLAVLAQPFKEGRYLITIAPFVVYFAVRGVRAIVAGPRWRALRWAVPTALLVTLVANNVVDTRSRFVDHLERETMWWGPEARDAQELFAAVESLTDPDDVVVFAQSRTMNLYTDRRAVQGNSVPMMLAAGDWYAMTRNSDYIQTLLTDADAADLGFEKRWENPSFVLWRIP
ncbi:MAG: hypothetical protein ACR2HQ_03945 [Ilumatobacteraceae bacterium]